MTTFQAVDRLEKSPGTSILVEDSLESELFASDHEAGVACFVDADDDLDEELWSAGSRR